MIIFHKPNEWEQLQTRIGRWSLEVHTTGRNGKIQVKLVEVEVNDLVDLRDMLSAVCEDLGRGES